MRSGHSRPDLANRQNQLHFPDLRLRTLNYISPLNIGQRTTTRTSLADQMLQGTCSLRLCQLVLSNSGRQVIFWQLFKYSMFVLIVLT